MAAEEPCVAFSRAVAQDRLPWAAWHTWEAAQNLLVVLAGWWCLTISLLFQADCVRQLLWLFCG